MTVVERIDLRCPVSPVRLLSRVLRDGQKPRIIPDGNLIEADCHDCRRRILRDWGVRPINVLHRFNLLGEVVETAYRFERNGELVELTDPKDFPPPQF